MADKHYGQELVIDLKGCDVEKFTRPLLDDFFTELCRRIDMEKCDVHFWDDYGVEPLDQQTNPKTKGTSAVCFILTSTIVIHTLDLTGKVYINIFSCKHFNSEEAFQFCALWFNGIEERKYFLHRG